MILLLLIFLKKIESTWINMNLFIMKHYNNVPSALNKQFQEDLLNPED